MSARSTAPRTPVPEGALLRIGVDARWTDDVPPVPGGRHVTVSLSSPALVAADGPALRALGYDVVGVGDDPAAGTAGAALFLVRPEVARNHPIWWRTLAARAERIHHLAHGPVIAVFGATIAVHLDPDPS